MKPNFKPRAQLTKNTFDGQNKPGPMRVQQKIEDSSEQFEPLGESLVGERQFIYFDNKSSINNNSQKNNQIEQNKSLMGTMEKVYFTNASSINRQEHQKDKRLHQEINAFKPSEKLIHEQPQNFKKVKSSVPAQNSHDSEQCMQQEDENQFLELNNIGKWQKGNKSTVISEEMKKMNSHLENRLTQTKWVRKKSSHHQETSKTQKNSSIAQNQSTQMNSSITNNSMKIVKTQKNTNASKNTGAQHKILITKGAQKYMQGMSEQAKGKVSSMTSWKEEENKQEEEQIEDQAEEGEQEDQEESEQEQEDQEEEESQEEQDQQEQQEDQEGDQDQSSGQEGWDQPAQEQLQQEPQQQKEDPFAVPQAEVIQQVKAKKWGSKIQVNSKTGQPGQPVINPSIRVQGKQEQVDNQEQNTEQIQDLTQGQIPNEQIDPGWQKIELILLRIQKMLN